MASLAERLTACKLEIERLKAAITESKLQKCNGGLGHAALARGQPIATFAGVAPTQRRTLTGHHGKVYAADWTSNGEEVVSTGQDSKLIHWDVKGNHKLSSFPLKTVWAMACSFLSETAAVKDYRGSAVACGGLDNACSLYDLGSGTKLMELQGHEGYVSSIAVSPTAASIATASGDGSIRVWDLASGRTLRVLTDHASDVLSVSYSPLSCNTLVSGSVDATAKVWDDRLPKPVVRTFTGARGQSGVVPETATSPAQGISGDVNAVRFLSSGAVFATAGEDAVFRLFDLRANAVINALSNDAIVTAATSFDVSPSGRLAFVGHEDSNSYCWDLLSDAVAAAPAGGASPLSCLSGHGNHVSAVRVAPRGKALLSASWDSEIIVWG